MKKTKKVIMIVLILMNLSQIGNANNSKVSGKQKVTRKNVIARKNIKNNKKELNSKEYEEVLNKFMNKAEKYIETGDKIKLVDDYIKDIENVKVSKKALEDNIEKDKEAFSLVEVTIFMKSLYSEREEARKLTNADYERIQRKFTNTNKFKQLEGYVEIQPIENFRKKN